MKNQQPLAVVIRIPNVVLARSELNSVLGLSVDRYERSSDHAPAYAQIDIADAQDQWAAAFDCVQLIGAPIQRLLSEGLIGPPALDVAIGFPFSSLSISAIIPARLAAVAGETGMDVHLSAYRTKHEA